MPQLWGFYPLDQRGIKGDFKIMLKKNLPLPLLPAYTAGKDSPRGYDSSLVLLEPIN